MEIVPNNGCCPGMMDESREAFAESQLLSV